MGWATLREDETNHETHEMTPTIGASFRVASCDFGDRSSFFGA